MGRRDLKDQQELPVRPARQVLLDPQGQWEPPGLLDLKGPLAYRVPKGRRAILALKDPQVLRVRPARPVQPGFRDPKALQAR